MLGWVNRSIKEFVVSTFGVEAWDAIVEKYPHDSQWRSQCPYSDSLTVELVVTSAAHLGVSPEDALEAYGTFFVSYVESLGYKKLLEILGNTLYDFLLNLNNLHLLLQFSFPEMISPAFRCEACEDSEEGFKVMRLSYSSARAGLYRIVFGIVKEVAKRFFSSEATMALISEATLPHSHFLYVMDITVKSSPTESDEAKALRVAREVELAYAAAQEAALAHETLVFTADLFYQMFPFALFMDRECTLVSSSPSLHRMAQWREGQTLEDHFTIVHPRGLTFEIEALLQLARSRTAFVMKLKCNGLELKGQFLDISDARIGIERRSSRRSSIFNGSTVAHDGSIVFIAAPRVRSLEDMRRFQVFMSDMPLHDSSMDMVLLAEQRSAENELSRRIEVLNLQLEEERKRSDRLLYQMLPVGVANSLRTGAKVNAQHHPEVTILFSDIVGFTIISAKTAPENVFRMLDDLYTALDTELAQHFPELYKVETIGDAYMVVGNLTEPCHNHADRMIQFAARMLSIAETVDSGVPGLKVQLRVGLHTGSVVAGVVGKKMPSFCLFGDTVNTASRMESNSQVGRIHISDNCRQAIRAPALLHIESRGEIDIKGKGQMHTHFVQPAPGPLSASAGPNPTPLVVVPLATAGDLVAAAAAAAAPATLLDGAHAQAGL
jgi:guanylate cyclase soluble subunit beta